MADMASTSQVEGLHIGAALKRGRTRLQLDIGTAEQRTKIRARYLRALEAEEWEVLPGPTYVKGFLRTYGSFLGLDGEALVDEYRRSVESRLPGEDQYPLTDTVLEHRRRPGDGERHRGRTAALIVLVAVALVGGLALLGLEGDSDDDRGRGRDDRGADAQRGDRGGADKPTPAAGQATVTLTLAARDDVRVCLARGNGDAQIDSQTLTAGSVTGPFRPPADRYRLDLASGGTVALTVNDEERRLHARGPSSFEITSGGISPIGYRGPRCP
jgi:cytoskeleton protein RodZ